MPRPRANVTLADVDRAAQLHPPTDDRVTHSLPLERIRRSPKNPRTALNVDELAASLQSYGLLQPILVRPVQGGWEIIAGHRRYCAAAQLGWKTIECMVRSAEVDEAFVLTLVENLQRDDLSPSEEAAGLETLLRERHWSTHQVAAAVKRSQSFVSRRLRVFEDPVLAPYVLRNQVPVAIAEETLTLGPSDRRAVIEQAASDEWTRADARRAVAAILQPNLGRRPHGLTRMIRELRLTLDRLQPQDLTDADRKELFGLFKVGQWVGRTKPRTGPPVMPTIAPSGRVFVDETQDPAVDGTTKHAARGGVLLLERPDGSDHDDDD